jgi:O-antigen ligase
VIGGLWLAFVALLPVQFATGLGVRFAPSDLLSIALALLLVAAGGWRLPRRMFSVWILAILLLFAAGTVRAAVVEGAPSRYVVLQKDVGLLLLLLQYGLVGAIVRDRGRAEATLRAFVGSVALLNGLALAEFGASQAGWLDLVWMNYGRERLSGLLVDPNAYGGLLATALPFLIAPGEGERRLFGRRIGVVAQVSLLAGVVLTYSRSAWVAVGLMLLYAAWRRPAAAARLGLASVGALLALLAITGPEFLDVLREMGGRRAQVIARVETSWAAWSQFLEHPAFGVGLGWFHGGQDYIVHNTALWFLAEMGVVGLLGFLGLIGWMIRRAVHMLRHVAPEDHGIALGLAGGFVVMLALSLGIEALFQRHWWLLMGLLAAWPYGSDRPGEPRPA